MWWPDGPVPLVLGRERHDLSKRALVVGIAELHSYERGEHSRAQATSEICKHVESLLDQGAELIEITGPSSPKGTANHVGRVTEVIVATVAALRKRFEVPLGVATCSSAIAAASFEAGAVLGSDSSGFADPSYLPVVANAGATVATVCADLPDGQVDQSTGRNGVVARVEAFLVSRADAALAAGISSDHIVLDAGIDFAKTPDQAASLLWCSRWFASLGYALMCSAPSELTAPVPVGLTGEDRSLGSVISAALAITGGCRLIRTHDVASICKVRDLLAAIIESAPSPMTASRGSVW